MKTSLSFAAMLCASLGYGFAVPVGSGPAGTLDDVASQAVSRGNTIDTGFYGDSPRGSGFIFGFARNGNAPEAFMFYTNDLGLNLTDDGNGTFQRRIPGWITDNASNPLAGVTVGDIESLGVFDNGNSAVDYRFALETSDGWFVSADAFDASSGWSPNALSLMNANWIGDVFEPNVMIDKDIMGSGLALDASAEILGFGLYADTDSLSSKLIRFDSLAVTLVTGQTYYQHFLNIPGDGGGDLDASEYNWAVQRYSVVPEPSTLAFFGLGALGLAILVRRRARS